MYIPRVIESDIQQDMFRGKAIILYGPRQCGKTTLVKTLVGRQDFPTIWLNGDDMQDASILDRLDSLTAWKNLVGKNRIVVVDEAQKVFEIGNRVKLVTDGMPHVQIILTGRKFVHTLLPLSFHELASHRGQLEEMRACMQRLVYGSYPAIVNDWDQADRTLEELATSYLFRDVMALEGVRKPRLLQNLVLVLAHQVGSEVSLVELGQTVGADRITVDRYISILEQAYIVFTLPAFSRNTRSEIKKLRKVSK